MTEQLGPEARAALARYRETRTPAAPTLDRVRAGVDRRIAAGDPGMALEPTGTAVRPAWWIVGGVATAGVGAALLASLWGTNPEPSPEPAPPPAIAVPQPVPTDAPDRSATIEPPADPAPTPSMVPAGSDEPAGDATDLDEDLEAAAPATRPRAKSRAGSSRSDASPTGAEPDSDQAYDQVKAEMALLGRAQAALQAGDAADALRLLDRHERKYPRGYLAEERMLQRMVALCELGRTKQARRAVQAFLEARPNSPMAAHAASICKEREAAP